MRQEIWEAGELRLLEEEDIPPQVDLAPESPIARLFDQEDEVEDQE